MVSRFVLQCSSSASARAARLVEKASARRRVQSVVGRWKLISSVNFGPVSAASGRARVEKRAGESSNELGGAQNDADPGEQQAAVAMHITSSSTSAPARNKFNALNVLREIYLDSNSKVTMFSPDETGKRSARPEDT